MPLQFVRDDITRMHVDAIVNAANNNLMMGGGVCGQIFRSAGTERMSRACAEIGFCNTGGAVITPGFNLPAKFVIHCVGPVWEGGDNGEKNLLSSCYLKALNLARAHHLRSIAFPLISSGIYGYPKDQALNVAIEAIRSFLMAQSPDEDMDVWLVIFDHSSFSIGERLFADIKRCIDDSYAASRLSGERERERQFWSGTCFKRTAATVTPSKSKAVKEPSAEEQNRDQSKELKLSCETFTELSDKNLENLLHHTSETFSQRLLRLIDEKGLTDPEVYRRADLDRKLFSKIRSHPHYKPKKNTALALGIALCLNKCEMDDLLRYAGYALNPSDKVDIIVGYFIDLGVYDIFKVNAALFDFNLELLGQMEQKEA